MICTYGISQPGAYHIKKGIVCQDSHLIALCDADMAIAAVADGLGSAEHSDTASKIAVTTSVDYCRKSIADDANAAQIPEIIRAAFTAALKAIEEESTQKDRLIELYDTTLTLAVFIRDVLYYGHSGDSGIIALTTQGRYEQVTTQQRDNEGRVFPLFFRDMWEFTVYDKKVAGVMLATDGMLETFFPFYLRNSPEKIHITLAQYFMNPLNFITKKNTDKTVEAEISEFMERIPDEQVNDDKTVVVLVNTSIKTKKQPDDYYKEPDWAELKKKYDEQWKRAAYPSLFDKH